MQNRASLLHFNVLACRKSAYFTEASAYALLLVAYGLQHGNMHHGVLFNAITGCSMQA